MMPVPDYQTLMRPVLVAAKFGEVRMKDVTDKVSDHFGLTVDERDERMTNGQRLIVNRVAWARIYLVKAGLLEATRRGFVAITDQGQAALAAHPERIDNTVLKGYPSFRAFLAREASTGTESVEAETAETASVETPEERLRTAHRSIEAALKSELIDRILSAKSQFFEKMVIALLLGMGYGGSLGTGRVLGRSGDNGVDGVIDQDALGLDRIYVQAKRYARDHTISSGDVRNFFGGLDHSRANKGVFITTSSFSKSAIDTAGQLSKRIVLIDGDRLAALMIQFNVGTRIEETFHLRRMDEDFFLDE